jgi:uncharacterized protein YkwD
MRTLALSIVLFIAGLYSTAQIDTSLRSMNKKEIALYNIIIDARLKKNLPEIPLSNSLNKVAQCHVRDLNAYPPSNTCGLHSWSKNGPWEPVCYKSSKKGPQLMWSKPSELTDYKGNGFEIAFWSSSSNIAPEEIFHSWETSYGHYSVIMNKGIWAKYTWQAIGVAAEGNYAVVWFGKESDPK